MFCKCIFVAYSCYSENPEESLFLPVQPTADGSPPRSKLELFEGELHPLYAPSWTGSSDSLSFPTLCSFSEDGSCRYAHAV